MEAVIMSAGFLVIAAFAVLAVWGIYRILSIEELDGRRPGRPSGGARERGQVG